MDFHNLSEQVSDRNFLWTGDGWEDIGERNSMRLFEDLFKRSPIG